MVLQCFCCVEEKVIMGLNMYKGKYCTCTLFSQYIGVFLMQQGFTVRHLGIQSTNRSQWYLLGTL